MGNDLGGLLFNTEKRPNRTGTDAVAGGGNFDPTTDNYFNKARLDGSRARSRSATRRGPTGPCAGSITTART